MKLLRIDDDTTANIGIISGGTASNVVCPEVNILAEARSTIIEKLENQTTHMLDIFKKTAEKYGGSAEISVERLYGSFLINEDDEFVTLAKKAFNELGYNCIIKSSGGGSDTNILNNNGIKALNLGIGERKPHTLEEYYYIDDLEKVANTITKLISLS